MSELSNKMIDALNKQIAKEYASAYIYLSMSCFLEDRSFNGMASWMRRQANEELEHGNKIIAYMHNRGVRASLQAIPAPKNHWTTILSVFEETYKHECAVTESITQIVELALKEKDHATHEFLQWYIKEQVEEESISSDIVTKLKMGKEQISALFIIDKILAERKD